MGYTTYFHGQFDLDKPLTDKDYEFLVKFNETRRMKRATSLEYGVDGEFYVGHSGLIANVLDSNKPPSTQPGLNCDWRPTEDRMHIEWNEGEKFYAYVEWIAYLVDAILEPRGYVLNGRVAWEGEESGDLGIIVVENNVVSSYAGEVSYPGLPASEKE